MASQDYKLINVEKSSLPDDNYGNSWYTVDVDGHDGPLLWLTKTTPEKGQVVYGHTELSKSGKSMLFKKDKREDGEVYTPRNNTPTHVSESLPPSQSKAPFDDRSNEIRWSICIKEANMYVTKYRDSLPPEEWATEVVEYAEELYKVSQMPTTTTAQKMFGEAMPL